MLKGDFIFVKNLAVKAVCGTDAWQRAIPQPLNLSLKIFMDHRLKQLGLTDDLRRSLNYDSLSTQLVQALESKPNSNINGTLKTLSDTIKPQLLPSEYALVSLKQPKNDLFSKFRNVDFRTNSNKVWESVNKVQIPVIIGINDLERVFKQPIEIDLEVTRSANDLEVFGQENSDKLYKYISETKWLTIESFVNDLAEVVCARYPYIEEVKVRATKPCALNLADGASVQVTRKPSNFTKPSLGNSDPANHTVYIAFGTNIGPRLSNIRQAIDELKTRDILVEKSSKVYESVPMYYTDQPLFMNGVFKCRTKLSPVDLLAQLKEVEYKIFGRVKKFDNGPRPLDLDIILYDNEFIESDLLTIPHKDMLNRSFVLKPLHDVWPECPFPNPSDGLNAVLPLKDEKYLVLDKTHLMSILNATPDSFSDGGNLQYTDSRAYAADQLVNGADIIDVGGYSTRPGASNVSLREETRRVCHAIEQIKLANEDAVISVDTFRSAVAHEALKLGASMVNDVFSGQLDNKIFDVVADHQVPLVLNHSRGDPQTMNSLAEYKNVVQDVALELNRFVDQALLRGVNYWQLVLDPGLGFAKTSEHDITLIKNFDKLKKLAYDLPWLVGPSRKRFIGNISSQPDAKLRDPGTQAVLSALIAKHVDIVRVHNTKDAKQTIQISDAIYR